MSNESESSPARRQTFVAWPAWCALGLFGMGLFHLSSGLPQDCIYDAIRLSAGVVVLLAVRARRPPDPRPWKLIALAQISFGLGDVVWDVIKHSGNDPFPSAADALYLAGYALAVTGLLLLGQQGKLKGDLPALVDSAIIAIGAGVVLWLFVAGPSADQANLSDVQLAFTLAYPLADLVLFAVAVRLAIGGRQWHPANLLLIGGIVSLLLGDLGFQILQFHGAFEDGTVVDLAWLLAAVLWGAAALHPTMTEVVDRRRPARPRTVALLVGSLVGPVLAVTYQLTGHDPDLLPVLVPTIAVLVLVWIRMSDLMSELASTAAAERDAEVRVARAQERERIAREMHDFVTYSLGAVVVQAGGARRMLAVGSEHLDEADIALATIEQRGREALEEMRRLLVGLRNFGEPDVAGDSRLGGLHTLAAPLRAAGTLLSLDIEGDLTSLPATVDLAAFRVIQEALNNVQRHAAGAPTSVVVRRRPGEVVVLVENGAPPMPAQRHAVSVAAGPGGARDDDGPPLPEGPFAVRRGLGLVGMRERAEFLGGDLSAGPTPAGGWAVGLRLPA